MADRQQRPLSIERARQFYMENRDKFPGMNMTEAVANMVRSGSLPIATAPALAEVATAPVPTAAQVAPPAVPEQEPAPAPAPQPEYKNPYVLALEAFNKANPVPSAPAPTAKGPVDYLARARAENIEAERSARQQDVAAAEGAQIDPAVAEVLTGREGRVKQELANIDKDRQQAIWMAIAQAGFKMAQSQSPYFLQALASGMEAGLNGFDEAKAKAAEKKARLQTAEEDIKLSRADLLSKARDRAVGERRAVKQDVAAEQALVNSSLANLIRGETADEVIAGAGLENQFKKAQIDNIKSIIGERAAAGRRAEAAARGGGGGGGGFKTSDVKAALSGAISDNRLIDAQLQNMMDPPGPAEKRDLMARRAQNNEIIKRANSLLSGKIGVADSNPLGLKF